MTAPDPRDSVELLPCPGCGDTRTRVIGGPGTRGGPEYWAGCDCCRWRTWGNTEAEAIEAWNRRALPQQAGGEDGWIAVADRLPTLEEWPIGTIRTALTFHPMRGIRTETMRPEHWNHIDRRGPGYHGPEVTHWRFPPPPPAAIDAAIGGAGAPPA